MVGLFLSCIIHFKTKYCPLSTALLVGYGAFLDALAKKIVEEPPHLIILSALARDHAERASASAQVVECHALSRHGIEQELRKVLSGSKCRALHEFDVCAEDTRPHRYSGRGVAR